MTLVGRMNRTQNSVGRINTRRVDAATGSPGKTNLVSWWALNETTGTDVADSHGSNSATATGATADSGGVVGYCRYFGANNHYINVGNKVDLKPANPSLVVWAKHDDYTAAFRGGIVQGRMFGAASAMAYQLVFNNGVASARVSDGTTSIQAEASIGDNNWHMWALVFDGSTVSISKDGGSFVSISAAITIAYPTGTYANFVIGPRLDSLTLGYRGLFDEISVWNSALTETNLAWLYNSGSGRAYSAL